MTALLLLLSQLTQLEEVWRSVGVALTAVGLLCYALSSSFTHLFGDRNSLKTSLYTLFSFIACLAVWFAEKLQRSRVLRHKGLVKFLVTSSTTVFLFFSDRAARGKPDAYSLVSCVAFAVMSRICGFGELLSVFTAALTVHLMGIKLFLCSVGIVFSFIFIVPGSYLHNPLRYLLIQEDEQQVVIEVASLQFREDQPQEITEVASLQSREDHLPQEVTEVASLQFKEDHQPQEVTEVASLQSREDLPQVVTEVDSLLPREFPVHRSDEVLLRWRKAISLVRKRRASHQP